MTITRNFSGFEAFELLYKNLFNQDSCYSPVTATKIGHPVDIWEDNNGLHLEVAGTGLTKNDIEIKIEGDSIKISHTKTNTEGEVNWIYSGISKKSFNIALKIPTKFDTAQAKASMENGLLHIFMPFSKSSAPRTLDIE